MDPQVKAFWQGIAFHLSVAFVAGVIGFYGIVIDPPTSADMEPSPAVVLQPAR
jgi:hypothetical protein